MQHDTIPMGSAFSQWESLTKDYLEGLVASRRREPGASAKMMRLAREMQECEARCGGPCTPPAPRRSAARAQPTIQTPARPAGTRRRALTSAFGAFLGAHRQAAHGGRDAASR